MRCKLGDLAIVTRSIAGNEGKIVTCVEYLGIRLWSRQGGPAVLSETWRVDRLMPNLYGDASYEMEDRQLTPIRPGDLEDETPTELIKELSCEHQ